MQSKRLTAIIISIVMLLPILAFAQEPAMVSRAAQLLESGKTIESTVSFEIDKNVLGMLMSGMASPEESEEELAKQEAQNNMVLDIISKLRIDGVKTKDSFSVTVGSEKAPLFDIAGDVSLEKEEVNVSTGLIPGYVFSIALPEGTLVKPSDTEAMKKLYEESAKALVEALKGYADNVIKPAFEENKGNFVVEGREFDLSYAGMFDTHMAAMLMQMASEFISSNEEFKNVIDMSLANQAKTMEKMENMTGAEDPEAAMGIDLEEKAPKNADELIKKINDTAKGLLENEKEDLASLSVYENSANKDLLMEITKIDNSTRVITYVEGEGKVLDIKALVNENEAEETAAVDWKKLEEDIKNGEDYASYMLQVVAKDTSDDKNMMADLSLNVLHPFIPVSLNLTISESKEGEYKADAKLAIAVLSPEPVITVNVSAKESDKAVSPVAEGEKIVISEESNEEELSEKIEALFTQNALPLLLQNLPNAFPEEAEVLMSSMNSAALEDEGVTQAD
ncbi:MAG: hypothetical protein Q4E07_00145 [Eubacteriales bacterium]|nr:hypothetical protein [Eubacteriales bacterium]